MKFKEYLKTLNNFAEENPLSKEMEVIYSTDDEGNEYKPVVFSPTIGFWEDGEFTSEDLLEEEGFDDVELTAICIN